MASADTLVFPESSFTEIFVRQNKLDGQAFAGWFFHAGMEFGSQQTWWGGKRKRARPHEGVDLCFYRGVDDAVFRIDDESKIPAMYDGIVVKIMDDFLGKTIVLEHSFPSNGDSVFLSIYGHTKPMQKLEPGQRVNAGGIMATLAPHKNPTAPVPHLHLTLGSSPRPVSYEMLDWSNIGNPDNVHLVDPLQVIGVSL